MRNHYLNWLRKSANLTVIEAGMAPQLHNLEAVIREKMDNPDDFIDSLLEE